MIEDKTENFPQDEKQDEALRILRKYWQYPQFRGVQREIIDSVMAGRDTLGLMPTGGGKSLTFQVPALILPGVTLVITPLIALMKDQVNRLRNLGIQASAIFAGMNHNEMLQVLDNAVLGGVKLLYISPERIATTLFLSKMRHIKVSLITVDEAHCISQWGYDFRPSYLQISNIRKLLPGVPVLALTATATPEVADDIQQLLGFAERNVFQMSFKRDNLAYVVRKTNDKRAELIHILRSVDGCAIIYTRSRQRTKEIAELLNDNNISATYYHAGLNPAYKDERQALWQKGEVRVMVATNAFGMGIDKADVRLVIHVDCPDCIEAYFQEAGRAGRDGKHAYAILLFNDKETITLRRRIDSTFPALNDIRTIYDHLAYFFQIAAGYGCGVSHQFDIDRFCRRFHHFPIQVNSALLILQRCGYLKYEQNPDKTARVRFILERDQLYRINTDMDVDNRVINTLLRLYCGMFTEYTPIELNYLAQKAGITHEEAYQSLRRLTSRGIIDFIPASSTPYIVYTRQRDLSERLVFPKEVYEERKKLFAERIEAMIHYATVHECRSKMLLAYFGETASEDCGQCDVCLEKKKIIRETMSVEDSIMALLNDGKPHNIAELTQLPYTFSDIADVITQWAEKNIIRFNDNILQLKK